MASSGCSAAAVDKMDSFFAALFADLQGSVIRPDHVRTGSEALVGRGAAPGEVVDRSRAYASFRQQKVRQSKYVKSILNTQTMVC